MSYICKNQDCSAPENKKGKAYPSAMECPFCDEPLVEIISFSDTDLKLLESLPYVIAYPLKQTLLENNAPQRLNYFIYSLHNYLKYLALLSASEFFNSPFKERKIVDLFFKNLIKPSLGHWNAFTRDCLTYLKTQNHSFFCPDLFDYYENVETGKKIKMYNGEIEVVDSYNGGTIRYIKQPLTAIGILINFRNRLYHTPTIDIAASEKLWNDYFPIFRTLLEQLTFCEKFPMLKQETGVYYSLQGIEIKPFKSKINIDSNVAIYNSDDNTSMPVIPFFIIPGELAIERDEKANIMAYESNNGKTITFFSPEGMSKQISGKLLERLDLLLRDKQKEIPYTPETFTKDVFEARIAEENKFMLKSLVDEKKVIEGIYQHREEIEIKLREWIGARANIFFIAAEAGSGKTNLLVEMQRQYAERNLMSLFIRASRMEKKSLKEELCYQLNMDFSLEIAQYTSLAGTQEDPFFILIDGLNESSYAENIWQEILEISKVFEPGSLKFIITSRANTKIDIDRYVLSEYQLQYIYGENKDHVKSLSGFAFWLTPLDMKEMESAWGSYVAYDRNRFKPLFSFNDIATFDRGLYLQINNPLVLRIFLETYKGKNLPKKGTKHLHVWKDWFATFSYEEQKFMKLLENAIWEQGENELLLDDVLNNKNLQSYFLNDNSSAPYLRLYTLGWISRYIKDLTVYVSFTVEGLLLYLLGTKLNQQNPIITSDVIGEILNNGTKLQKSAIESFLCEQALEGKIDLITHLIDEGEEKLELCVTPLLYFLKSQGVEKTIEKLLENATENDWKIMILLKRKLYSLELLKSEREISIFAMNFNQMETLKSINASLEFIVYLDKEKAEIHLNKLVHRNDIFDLNPYLLLKIATLEMGLLNFEKSLFFIDKYLDIVFKLYSNKKQYEVDGLLLKGQILSKFGKLQDAITFLKKALILAQNMNYYLGDLYNAVGIAYEDLGEYDKAIENYEMELNYYIEIKNIRNIHFPYAGIARVYTLISNYIKALDFYLLALANSIRLYGAMHGITRIYYEYIALTYEIINDGEKALEFYIKSAEISFDKEQIEDESTKETITNILRLGKEYGKLDDLSNLIKRKS